MSKTSPIHIWKESDNTEPLEAIMKLEAIMLHPRDIEILGWCPVGPWGEGASLSLVGNPSSDGVTIKCLMG